MLSRRQFVAGTLAATTLAPLANAQATQLPPKPAGALDLMTYNLRYASATGANAWPTRRPVMRNLLLTAKPDIFGTQEGLYPQLKAIASDLPAYDWIGLGREGGSRGEFMAVFFRRDRFEPLEFDHFWLSDTPDVIGSATWGNNVRRMLTWVHFEDRETGKRFHFWNTHFDHQVENARQKAAALVLERIRKVDAATPLVLLGDFNAESGRSRSYEILVKEGGLRDTWHDAAARSEADANSFNDFSPLRREGIRIDWILCRGAARIDHAAVVTTKAGDQWPSDHCPVTTRLTWT